MAADSEVLADSPLVFLKLADTSSTTAADSSGNARNGTYATTSGTGYLLNQTKVVPAEPGGAVRFVNDAGAEANPSTGYVTIPYGAWTNTTGPFSVEFWYFPPASGRSGGFILGHRATVLQWDFLLAASGGIDFRVWDPDTSLGAQYAASANEIDVFASSSAYHIVGVYTGSRVQIYVNAAKLGDVVAPASLRSNTTDAIGINSTGAAGSSGIIGRFAWFAMYGTALSAERIAAHYNAGLGGIELSLNDAIAATTSMTPTANAMLSLADAASMQTSTSYIFAASMSLSAAMTAESLLEVRQILGMTLMDNATMTSAITSSKFMTMTLQNIAGMSAALGLNGRMGLALSDVVSAAVVIQAGEETYNGWIVNPNLAASAGLEGFNFNSFAKHKGRSYGIGPGGVYELGGPNDNGANIDAFVGLPKLNFGTANKKRVPYAYIGAAGEKMVLRVVVDDTVYTYTAENATTDMGEQRIKTGKGLKGNYWQFELVNQDGADFDIDSIKFMPIVLERRRGE